MAENGILERLASELSLEERKNLLEKLSGVSNITQESLYYEASSDVPAPGVSEQYAKLPWYSRFWLFILSIFKSRSPLKLFEDQRMAGMGREIDARWPGLYDYQKGLLLPPFHAAVSDLKEGARFFYTTLDSSVNQDKGAFYAFLGSLELGNIHSRLLSGTDPERISGEKPGISDTELRQEAFGALDDTLGEISAEERQIMYDHVRSLHYLKELASFLFDRVIMAFGFNPVVSGQTCSIRLVRDMLNSLNNILYSLRTPPSMALLESMFVFIIQEKEGERGFDLDKAIQAFLAQAEESFLRIKQFNLRVPLTRILRCANRNMALMPNVITGGEDWFALYQDYWKKYTDTRLGAYLGGRRRRELLKIFGDFFKGAELSPLANAASDTNPDGFPLKGAFALSFLLTFRKEVFLGDLSGVLKPIFTQGEFAKRETRAEFTEWYEHLLNMETEIGMFSTDISPDDGLGKRYAQIRGDMSSLAAKRRMEQIVLGEAADKAQGITTAAGRALQGLVNLLNGIIAEEPGGKYGALLNLSKLGDGGGIPTTDLIAVVQKLQQALKILNDIELMEAGK